MPHADDLHPRAPARIVILTGAGVSAESGVPTFRGPGGLWEGHRIEEVATPEAFARDPALVQRFYDERRAALARVRPNAAHLALARLDAGWVGGARELLLVTQNVDDLHERAGSRRLRHLHGALKSALCAACGGRFGCDGALTGAAACPACGAPALRPDVVWFGEMPHHLDEIERALMAADLFVAIGTSGNVYPAAGFVDLARQSGACCLELNLDCSLATDRFHHSRRGPAGALVPALVAELLGA